MGRFRFSVAARADLRDIASHTLEAWGPAQARRYLDQLQACCERVAENPVLARPCDGVRPGYFRVTEGRHTLFFRRDPGGVLIVRILHDRMEPAHPATSEAPHTPAAMIKTVSFGARARSCREEALSLPSQKRSWSVARRRSAKPAMGAQVDRSTHAVATRHHCAGGDATDPSAPSVASASRCASATARDATPRSLARS